MAARRRHLQGGRRLEGKVTKVVTFGAFVEILTASRASCTSPSSPQHHVENPREVVAPGQLVVVKILEIDSERRRLSLSVKRVSEYEPVLPPIALVEGDKPFLADELAAQAAGEPIPVPAELAAAAASGLLDEADESVAAEYADVVATVAPADDVVDEVPAEDVVAEVAPSEEAPAADDPADGVPAIEATEGESA